MRRAVAWGDSFLRGSPVQFLRVDEDREARAWGIILGHEDKDFSYTDATSFAVAESLGAGEVLSLDRHFRRYGRFTVLP